MPHIFKAVWWMNNQSINQSINQYAYNWSLNNQSINKGIRMTASQPVTNQSINHYAYNW